MEVHRQLLACETPENLGITQQKPKFPQYAVISKREESFATWPANSAISTELLAESGLVYTGVGDSVRCYYCGGGLRNWEPEDDPWVEHATWYPNCPHVLLVKGQSFIDQTRHSALDADGGHLAIQKPLDSSITSIAAQSCLQMGFAENKVFKAINKFISRHGHSNYKGEDLCRIILDDEEEEREIVEEDIPTNVTDSSMAVENSVTEDAQAESDLGQSKLITENEDEEHMSLEDLYAENCRLKESQLCKICRDRTSSIIFLPCGHMVTCPQCAPAFAKCPICRVAVSGVVKAYLS